MTLESENARLEQRVKELEALLYGHSDDVVSTAFQHIKRLEAQNEQLRKAYQTIHNDDCINYKARIAALEAALRYAKRFLKEQDVDMGFIDFALAPANPNDECSICGCLRSSHPVRWKSRGMENFCGFTAKTPEVRP